MEEEVQAEDMERMGVVCLCMDGSCSKLHRARPALTFPEGKKLGTAGL